MHVGYVRNTWSPSLREEKKKREKKGEEERNNTRFTEARKRYATRDSLNYQRPNSTELIRLMTS